jgi:hypothetical protein
MLLVNAGNTSCRLPGVIESFAYMRGILAGIGYDPRINHKNSDA